MIPPPIFVYGVYLILLYDGPKSPVFVTDKIGFN